MSRVSLAPIEITAIRAAQQRIRGLATRTPLLRFFDGPDDREIWIKPENVQPIGSFKLRGAGNAMRLLTPEQLEAGVCTASAGNMAQGVAWIARELGVPCTVLVPDHAPATKREAVERLGGRIIAVPFQQWWQAIVDHRIEGTTGRFIHPVSDPDVIAGNGTIGREILEDLPDVDTVLVPYGGGGLSVGIAAAIHADRPDVRIFGCEVETATPLHAAFAAGRPIDVPYVPSFVDGIGSRGVLPEMWPLVRRELAGARVVTLAQVADAIRRLIERSRLVAEGAGAASLAAALADCPGRRIVCVLSGGNIDLHKLAEIIAGRLP